MYGGEGKREATLTVNAKLCLQDEDRYPNASHRADQFFRRVEVPDPEGGQRGGRNKHRHLLFCVFLITFTENFGVHCIN